MLTVLTYDIVELNKTNVFCTPHSHTIFPACPSGKKGCEATQACEDNSLENLACCGPTKQYCKKTKKCEWTVTLDTICGKYASYLGAHFN